MGLQVRNLTLKEAFVDVWNSPDLPRLRDKIFSLLWFPPQLSNQNPLGYDDSGRPKVKFRHLVREFPQKCEIRCLRALISTLLITAVSFLILVPVFGGDTVPARGQRASDVYFWATLFDVLSTLFLTYLVVDATLLSRKFISRLTQISTEWRGQTFDKFAQRYGLPRSALADWIDLQYLARKTRCITALIYLPFLSLAVMILARNHLFDDFPTSWTVLAARAISVAVIIAAVLAYRSAAENARKAAREHLTAKLIAAQGDEKKVGQLERILNEIETLKEGAFAPLTSQPIVKAVLLPLVTYGGIWLAHLYGMPGT